MKIKFENENHPINPRFMSEGELYIISHQKEYLFMRVGSVLISFGRGDCSSVKVITYDVSNYYKMEKCNDIMVKFSGTLTITQ